MEPVKILFLAANPLNSTRLALDQEARDIEERLIAAKHRDSFAFKSSWAVQPGDLQKLLLREKPVVVHFSGHGAGKPGIVLHGANEADERVVTADALRHLFATLKDNVRVVVLNACYSVDQAEGIVKEIDFVIGMKDSIGDKAARVFAASFYTGLGFAKPVPTAFQLGVGALKLEGLVEDEDLPVLLVREGVDSETIFNPF